MLSSLLIAPVFVSVMPLTANADTGDIIGGQSTGGEVISGPSSSFTLQNPLKVDSIGGLVKNFVEIFSYIAILFAVLVLIYIGFQYVIYSAQGNSGKIKELHSWLLWTAVGVAVVIGARVIVEIIINTLGLTGTVSPGVIDSAKNALKP